MSLTFNPSHGSPAPLSFVPAVEMFDSYSFSWGGWCVQKEARLALLLIDTLASDSFIIIELVVPRCFVCERCLKLNCVKSFSMAKSIKGDCTGEVSRQIFHPSTIRNTHPSICASKRNTSSLPAPWHGGRRICSSHQGCPVPSCSSWLWPLWCYQPRLTVSVLDSPRAAPMGFSRSWRHHYLTHHPWAWWPRLQDCFLGHAGRFVPWTRHLFALEAETCANPQVQESSFSLLPSSWPQPELEEPLLLKVTDNSCGVVLCHSRQVTESLWWMGKGQLDH